MAWLTSLKSLLVTYMYLHVCLMLYNAPTHRFPHDRFAPVEIFPKFRAISAVRHRTATASARVGADLTSDDQAYLHASCNKLGQHYGMLNKQFYLGTYFAPQFDVIPGASSD